MILRTIVSESRTLSGWLAYLEQLHPNTIELGLARVDAVRRRMAMDPAFPIITVGGTNGKGSTCAMLEAMLHAAGYKVGCYTSPHLIDYNERVRIAKQAVSDVELCAAFEKVEAARLEVTSLRDAEGGGAAAREAGNRAADESAISLTYFEFGTLAAMQCFIEHKVDVAILEVGLGGRLDAVNVFDADCAVVCSVDIDHVDYLGDTRAAIAREKAGIFRKDKVAVYGDADMPQMIADEAARIGAVLWRFGRDYGCKGQALQWDFYSPVGERHALPIPALRGTYQLNNASAALAALDALRGKLCVSMEAVRRGLVEVMVPGRFQVLPGRPQIILDVAHNPHAARALAQNLAAMPPAWTCAVFAMLKDKDMRGVVEALKEHIDVWLLAGIEAPRGASAAELAQVLRAAGVAGEVRQFATVAEAWRQACDDAAGEGGCDNENGSPSDTLSRSRRLRAPGQECRITAFGSFYTVADVMRARRQAVERDDGKTTDR